MTLASRNGSAAPSDRKAVSKRRNGKSLPAAAAPSDDDVAIMDNAAAIACADDVAAPVAAPRPPYVPIQAAPPANTSAALDSAMGLDSDVAASPAPVVAAPHPLTNDATFGPLAVLRTIPAAPRAAIVVGAADVAIVVGAEYNLSAADVQGVRDGYGTLYIDPEIAAIVDSALPESTSPAPVASADANPTDPAEISANPPAPPYTVDVATGAESAAAPIDPRANATTAPDCVVRRYGATDTFVVDWSDYTTTDRAQIIASCPSDVTSPTVDTSASDTTGMLPKLMTSEEAAAMRVLLMESIVARDMVEQSNHVRATLADGLNVQAYIDTFKPFVRPAALNKVRRVAINDMKSQFLGKRFKDFDADRALVVVHFVSLVSDEARAVIMAPDAPISVSHIVALGRLMLDRSKESDRWTVKHDMVAALSALVIAIPDEGLNAKDAEARMTLELEAALDPDSAEAKRIKANAAQERDRAILAIWTRLNTAIEKLKITPSEVADGLRKAGLVPDGALTDSTFDVRTMDVNAAASLAGYLVMRDDPAVVHAILGRLLSYSAGAASKPAGPAGPSLNMTNRPAVNPVRRTA